ncbi:Tripartite tricarboxylate transporter TctB family protein [Pseudovibrio axinellae]|uniref:Tripartite tricarboxylate transporter TctB family protein n=1 Tax=Pseudovibrio axinellae TaxID=989403 RepID=A0A165XP33_9HYPH|nr:tripartite tricarboxylate transporter TctB family protein [Pseudovibrio axinellae]KZL17905.1 Tripartite tricarboxylate transporter TctB family protein [Pseudovibrio axinellae]SER58287.1 putative tricarboxylic transport membrane protein [Pseudovibrio axinellae]
MALDRWIALVILAVSLSYGYTAFFMMDAGLPPFMRFNPIWPSTFPKVISVLAAITSLAIVLGIEKKPSGDDTGEIDYRRLKEYKIGQAIFLLVLMATYALMLRPAGFLLSTVVFLVAGAALLGERRFVILIPVAALAAGVVWYLVQQTLGIYLSPLPTFLS